MVMLAEAPTVVATDVVLLDGLVSLVPVNGARVNVLVTAVATASAALTFAVTVIVQTAPAITFVMVPVICVALPTTLVAVTQLPAPPPTMAAVMLNTGVIKVGRVSVKIADPVPPEAELVTVKMYCMVVLPGTVKGPVVYGPVVLVPSVFVTEKSVPTLYVAIAVAVLLPDVVVRLPMTIVLV